MKYLIKWFLSALAVMLSAYLIPGVVVSGFWSAIWVAIFLAVINIFIKPILVVVTLPINILTLGFFTFVINAFLIIFTSSVVKGFNVLGFLPALYFSVVLTIVTYVLNRLVKP